MGSGALTRIPDWGSELQGILSSVRLQPKNAGSRDIFMTSAVAQLLCEDHPELRPLQLLGSEHQAWKRSWKLDSSRKASALQIVPDTGWVEPLWLRDQPPALLGQERECLVQQCLADPAEGGRRPLQCC